MMPTTKTRLKDAGFTLIESLVGISVLLVAVAGPLTIASRGVSSGSAARDQVLAYRLAEEGLELVHNRRDTNALLSVDWMTGMSGSDGCLSTDGCYVMAAWRNTPDFVACSFTGCPVFTKNTTTDVFEYGSGGGWATTKFTRTIKITSPVDGNTDQATVTSSVFWTGGAGVSRTVTLQDTLFRWQQ